MKNKFHSFLGVTSGRRGLNDPRITRESPANHPRITRVWKVIGTIFLLFTLGIGQMWGADAEIIKVVLSGSNGATKTMSGTIGGTCAVDKLSSSSPYKLNSNGAYVSLTLASGYFEATDIVTITGADGAHQIYYGTPTSGTLLCTTGAPSSGTITCKLKGLPANQNTIYLYRASDTYNKKVATMAVTRPDLSPTGTAVVSYTMTKGSANVEGDVSNVNTVDATSTAFAVSTLAIGSNNSKDGYCGQITGHAADYSATQYVQLGFTVASGYTFTPSSASIIVYANSTAAMKAKVVISDGTTSIESNELSCSSSADSQIEFASGAFTGKALSGNVTITIYQWGVASKRAYIKSPLTITGTVASAVAPSCSTPDAPTALAVGTITGSGATFTITDAANTNNYEIVCKESSTTPASDATPTETGTSQTIAVTGLDGGTTYYAWVRAVCDATHKSSWVALGSTFTTLQAITPSLSYANNPLVLTVRTSGAPTLTGNTGSGTVIWNSSAEGVATVDAGGNITAVAAGTTTITASIAANGGYAAGEATATVKVAAAPLGIVDQKLATGNVAWDASVMVTSDYTNITNITALSQHGSASASGNGNTSNGGQTSKIGTATGDFNAANYLELSFDVASGKKLDITAVHIPVQPVSSDVNNFKAVLSDDQGSTEIVGTKTNLGNGTLADITFSSYGELKGTVTLRIYAWGWSNGYRLGKNIYITGTVENDAPASYTLSYDANGGSGDAMENTTGTGTQTLRTNTYTKAGCTFQGWAISQANANAGTVAYTDGATNYELSADATLYAVWKLNTPAISCENNVVTITVPGSSTVYYTTDGETTPTSGSTAYDPSNKPVIAGTTTFKARAILANHVSSEVATQECAYVAPSTKRIYLKCGSTWCDASPKFFVHSWGSVDNDAELTQMTGCETDVYYADIPAGNTSLLFTRQSGSSTVIVYSGDNFWNKSADITIGDNDLFTFDYWDNNEGVFTGSTYAAPAYTISFNNGGGTGSMASISSLACGANQAITANAFTKDGYSFANWTADVAVTVNDATVSVGSPIDDEATLQNISGNIALTAQWTQEVPTSVNITGSWRYFPGQTISLTANPVGGTSDFTYQWQKYVTSEWQNIDGADEATYTKVCTIYDCGSYRCVVSKLGASVTSAGYDVHIYSLNGEYNGTAWVSNDITHVSGTTGKVELSLEAGRLYTFKVKDNFTNAMFGNSGYMLKSETGWVCPSNNDDAVRVFTGAAGTYTFTVDIAHVDYGTPQVDVDVTYPSVTHPVAGYVYYDKGSNEWTNIAAHWWKSANDEAFVAWGSNPWLTQSVEICGTTYYYMPKLEGYDRVIFHNAEGEGQTGDITVDASSSGKYISGNGTEWTAFPSYTVTFNSNGGSAVAAQVVGCGETATTPDPAPTRLNYDFEGWQLAGVDYNFATVVSDNITLDAVWTRKAVAGEETDITLVSTSAAIGSTSPLTDVYYGNASWTYTGNAGISTGGAMFGTPDSKKWVGFTIPAGYTATVETTCKKDADHARHCVLVTEAERAGQAGDATFLFDIAVNTDDLTATSASIEPGAYCVGSTSGGLTINSVIVHLTYLPTVKLKVLGAVSQTISITVGEKLGEIFASGSLPTPVLPDGYTFKGWKNEANDAAVDNNTVTTGSMVIYADLEADEYNVTLENGDTDGAATVHYGDEALTITTAVTGEEGDVLDGFYTAAAEGTKVADDEGNLVASVTGYTDENGKWIKESNATLYAIWTPYVPSSDATLSDLTVGGTTVTGFDAATISYDVELPFGTTVAPTVAGTANDTKVKSVVVTQASSANGDATVVVTAEDNSTKTYTVHFSVVATKDIQLVFKTGTTPCVGSASTASQILSNNAAVSTYINQITFTNVEGSGDNGAEGASLNVGKKAGNMFTLAAKAGFAMKSMNFLAKIQDATCEYSINGGAWTTLTSTSTSGDECYAVFSNAEVHEFRLRSTGASGVWIRNMQLTMIQACTPKTIAWTTAPLSEYEVGATGLAIAASANNGAVTYAASNAAITVNESTGALTINSLTNDIDLSASVEAGDGVTYCDEAASVVREEIKTYYLVTFDKQNETAVSTVKYYSGDAAIALPSAPSYSGYVFQGWFDAASGGNAVTSAITPAASRTVYAQWVAQCAGPMITTQPGNANYFVGRTATTLVGAASASNEGELTYTWYSCDDELKTNSVALEGAPTPSTAVAGTQYYYFTVTEAGCDVVRTSDVAVITVTEKDMLRIIKASLKGGSTTPDVEGYLAGSATANTQNYNSTYDGYKFGSNGHYVSLTLADGEEFQTGDVVNIYVGGVEGDAPAYKVYFATAASTDDVVATIDQTLNQGNNYINLPAALNGEQTFFLYRVDSKMNPYIKYVEVYRPYPVPVLTAMTINGSAATIAGTNVTAMIAANAELASLDIEATFMSNNPSETNGALGDWSEVSEGVYTASYVVTDKDDDTNTYLITLTRDVAIASVTISGETSVAAESQITLTATVLPNNVANKAVVWTSSDETKAVVDANGVVTGKAAGAVTITATAVADNTKYGTYDITVTPFIGTKYAYWFTKAADIPEDLANDDGTIFEGAPSSGSSTNASMTVEINGVERTFDVTARSGDVSFGTFHVPAGFTADLYMLVAGSGSPRTLKLHETTTSAVYTSSPDEFGSDAVKLVFTNVAAGNYTFDKGGQNSRIFMMVAELNSYPLSAISLADMTLRTEQSGTPAMTLTHAKAAITSQTWSIIENNAEGTTINASTGVITAGTTPGTITVQVVAEDAMGNEATSNICTVTIVHIFDRLDVTGSMTWNWNNAGNTENVAVATASGLALANYITGDEWKYISGTNGDWAYNTNNNGSYQGIGSLSFHTTVPGLVKISGKRISDDAVITINGTVNAGTLGSNVATLDAIGVHAGEVTIAPDANGMRITKIEFVAKADLDIANADYTRELSSRNIGTICLPKDGFMVGASVFDISDMDYKDNKPYKIYFVEVPNGAMEAGKPYVFLPDENSSMLGVFYTSKTPVDPNHHNGLYGYYSNDPEERYNVPMNDGNFIISGNKYWYVDDNRTYVPQNRAYIKLEEVPGYGGFTVSNPAPGRRISLGAGSQAPEVATDIDNVQGDNVQCTKVLINGEMYILRGEKMFDATGRLVK